MNDPRRSHPQPSASAQPDSPEFQPGGPAVLDALREELAASRRGRAIETLGALLLEFDPTAASANVRTPSPDLECARLVVAFFLCLAFASEEQAPQRRIRGRRYRANRPTLILCDDLQNNCHAESARQRSHARTWFHGTLLKAGTSTTNVVDLATALHREALAMELACTPGVDFPHLPLHRFPV